MNANEVINKLQGLIDNAKKQGHIIVRIEDIEDAFPELVESEDEKVRKALIEYFNEQCDMSNWNGIYGYQVVSWLEKQGKQKPVPDWMPKFLDELRLKKNNFDWDEDKDIEGRILAIIKWMNPNYFNGKMRKYEITHKH